MINKQGLWFLTLFSLILVLSVYYITMPDELLLTNNSNYTSQEVNGDIEDAGIVVEESELLVAMRVSLEEERLMKKSDLEGLLTSNKATAEEKNEALEELKYLNFLSGQEEMLEAKLKTELDVESFVKIDGIEVTVVAIKDKHDSVLANTIMRTIQSEFTDKMYITVKFEK
ncbi:MAG: SpoIIIAH-like family protein [Bacilli bacterium]|nr:SpoIIIAH-like family protein [Bacilli bacterium]